jgi:hypothetical protein
MITSHVKYPLVFSYFNQTWFFLSKYQILIFMKILSGSRVVLFEQMDRQSNMTKLIIAFRNFANAPIKRPPCDHVGIPVRCDFVSATSRLSEFHEILLVYRSALKVFSKHIYRKNRASYNLILANSKVKWGKTVPSHVVQSYGGVEIAAVFLNLDTRRGELSVSRRDRFSSDTEVVLTLHTREVPCSNPGVSSFLPGSSRRLPGKVGHARPFS